MKAKELIEKLAGYEDFDLKFCTVDKNTNSKFLGYSDKVIVLGEVES